MEFNQEKIAINRSGRKIRQNTSANKKESFKKHGAVKISWQQRGQMSLQYDTLATTVIFRLHIQHHTSQWPRKAFVFPYSYAGIAILKQPTGSSFFATLPWQWTDVSEESSTLTSPNPIRHLMVQFYIKNIISFWPRMAIIFYPKQEAGSLWFHAGWPT